MDEFQLIDRYFATARCARGAPGVALGIGDDCALLAPTPGRQLAISTDTLVAGVHFPADCSGFSLGRRALAVTASDLAAMGADPLGFTLALTLPVAQEKWLAALVEGLDSMAAECGLTLLGGDTCQGPLILTLTLIGELPEGQGLRRSGAHPGDLLCVSGNLGEGAAALELVTGHGQAPKALAERLLERYWAPSPQLALGRRLRGRASAALDVSDGLLADLGHIARASGVALWVEMERLPVAADLIDYLGWEAAAALALGGGDDYQLAFTLPEDQWPQLQGSFPQIRCIGRVTQGRPGVHVLDAQGREKSVAKVGYRHAWTGA